VTNVRRLEPIDELIALTEWEHNATSVWARSTRPTAALLRTYSRLEARCSAG
jgi:hypothetical protein